MDEVQFQKANIEWALGLLARGSFAMPNGRDSHVVAAEVLHESDDALLERGALLVTAYGQLRVAS